MTNNLQGFLVKSSFLFAFVGQTAVRSFTPDFHVLLLLMHCDDLQVESTPNGTSFDFVTSENGPVCLDLYSTPQYKLDQPDDCKGERCFPAVASNLTFPTTVKLNPIKMFLQHRQQCTTFNEIMKSEVMRRRTVKQGFNVETF